jgi:hypothetical protein
MVMSANSSEIDQVLAQIEPSSGRPANAHERATGIAAGRPIVVVLGMHRSGTSLLANVLHFLGADMADESDRPSRKNETGFWERPELVAMQDRVLEAIGRPIASPLHCVPFPAGWWRRKEVLTIRDEICAWIRGRLDRTAGLWGFKDPRTCRLLPLWWDIFRDLGLRVHYVIATRSPAEAAISMAEKNPSARPMSQHRGELMWLAYNYDIFRYVRDADPIVVDYSDWFRDPSAISEALSRRLSLQSDMTSREQADCIASIVRADLRHHREGAGSVVPRLQVSSLFYRSIVEVRGDASPSTKERDRCVDLLHAVYPFVEPIAQEFAESRPLTQAQGPVDQAQGPVESTTELAYLHTRLREEKEKIRAMKRLLAERKQQLQQADWRISDLEAKLLRYRAPEAAPTVQPGDMQSDARVAELEPGAPATVTPPVDLASDAGTDPATSPEATDAVPPPIPAVPALEVPELIRNRKKEETSG